MSNTSKDSEFTFIIPCFSGNEKYPFFTFTRKTETETETEDGRRIKRVTHCYEKSPNTLPSLAYLLLAGASITTFGYTLSKTSIFLRKFIKRIKII